MLVMAPGPPPTLQRKASLKDAKLSSPHIEIPLTVIPSRLGISMLSPVNGTQGWHFAVLIKIQIIHLLEMQDANAG